MSLSKTMFVIRIQMAGMLTIAFLIPQIAMMATSYAQDCPWANYGSFENFITESRAFITIDSQMPIYLFNGPGGAFVHDSTTGIEGELIEYTAGTDYILGPNLVAESISDQTELRVTNLNSLEYAHYYSLSIGAYLGFVRPFGKTMTTASGWHFVGSVAPGDSVIVQMDAERKVGGHVTHALVRQNFIFDNETNNDVPIFAELPLNTVEVCGTNYDELHVIGVYVSIGKNVFPSYSQDRGTSWVRLDPSMETTIPPVCAGSGVLVEGTGETGDFSATCGSDDSYWAAHGSTLFYQIVDPVAQFELTATAPAGFGGPTISVDIEASKQNANGNLNLRALLFNFTTGSYVSLPGIMPLATTDAVQNFVLPGGSDPADFIESGTNEVRLLLQTIQTSGLPTVRTQLDQVLYNFE